MADPHANYSPNWSTSPEWWAWVRATLGGSLFDPCPTNWDGEQSGLERRWRRPTYCNPPGCNSATSIKPWWAHAMTQPALLRKGLVWCFFNSETVFSLDPSPLDLPGWLVMPDRRIAFLRNGVAQRSPRNRTWFWSSVEPSRDVPTGCRFVGTGPTNIAQLGVTP